jgi:hypothetical protein
MDKDAYRLQCPGEQSSNPRSGHNVTQNSSRWSHQLIEKFQAG